MAVAIKQESPVESSAGGTTTMALTLPGAPTAGNLLVLWMAGDKNTGALTLSGFTPHPDGDILGASVSLYCYWKVSDGTETTINPSWATSSVAGNTGWYVELEDTAVSGSTWEVAGSASTTYSDTAVSSRSSNTTGALTNAALAFAGFGVDSSSSVASPLFSNSYVSEAEGLGFSGRGAIFVASKAVASGTTECTFSFTGSDQTSGAVIAFAKLSEYDPGGRYLLESGAPDGYLLEDGSGVLLREGDVGDDIVVTPGAVSLILTSFAPTVTVSNNQIVTPATAALALTSFAPVLKQVITPPVAALVLTPFEPSVTVGQRVVPDTAVLVLSTFAPTVTATAHNLVTPGVANLVLTPFAPVLKQVLTPGSATLSLTPFAPVLKHGVTPVTAVLVITRFAPVLKHGIIVPVKALVLTTFVPVIVVGGNIVVTPSTAILILTTFAPDVLIQSIADTTQKVVYVRIAGPGAPAVGGIPKVDSFGVAPPGAPAVGGAPKVTQQ